MHRLLLALVLSLVFVLIPTIHSQAQELPDWYWSTVEIADNIYDCPSILAGNEAGAFVNYDPYTGGLMISQFLYACQHPEEIGTSTNIAVDARMYDLWTNYREMEVTQRALNNPILIVKYGQITAGYARMELSPDEGEQFKEALKPYGQWWGVHFIWNQHIVGRMWDNHTLVQLLGTMTPNPGILDFEALKYHGDSPLPLVLRANAVPGVFTPLAPPSTEDEMEPVPPTAAPTRVWPTATQVAPTPTPVRMMTTRKTIKQFRSWLSTHLSATRQSQAVPQPTPPRVVLFNTEQMR